VLAMWEDCTLDSVRGRGPRWPVCHRSMRTMSTRLGESLWMPCVPMTGGSRLSARVPHRQLADALSEAGDGGHGSPDCSPPVSTRGMGGEEHDAGFLLDRAQLLVGSSLPNND
jgi:hypothetical protein